MKFQEPENMCFYSWSHADFVRYMKKLRRSIKAIDTPFGRLTVLRHPLFSRKKIMLDKRRVVW